MLDVARARMEVAEQRREIARSEVDSGEEHRRREIENRQDQVRQMIEQARERLSRLAQEVKRPDDPNLVRAREEMEARIQELERSRAEQDTLRERVERSGPGRQLGLSEADFFVAESRAGLVTAEIDLARAERRLARLESDGQEEGGQPSAEEDGDEIELELDLSGVPPAVSEAMQLLRKLLEDHDENEDEDENEKSKGEWVPNAPRGAKPDEDASGDAF
jgi:hypothetical protein